MFDKLINKVGLDRITHFGIGAALFSFFSLMFLYSLPMADGVLKLSWWTIQVPFILGYIVIALAAWFKEMNDTTPDKRDFVATMLGGVFVHIGGILGWLLHYGNGQETLIHSVWGWVVFGVVFVCLAGLWGKWLVKFLKDKKG